MPKLTPPADFPIPPLTPEDRELAIDHGVLLAFLPEIHRHFVVTEAPLDRHMCETDESIGHLPVQLTARGLAYYRYLLQQHGLPWNGLRAIRTVRELSVMEGQIIRANLEASRRRAENDLRYRYAELSPEEREWCLVKVNGTMPQLIELGMKHKTCREAGPNVIPAAFGDLARRPDGRRR